jgi:hypothetical protein
VGLSLGLGLGLSFGATHNTSQRHESAPNSSKHKSAGNTSLRLRLSRACQSK